MVRPDDHRPSAPKRPGTLASPETPLLEMKGISKAWPGIKALDRVDIRVDRGEVLAIIGENGAGKSTLIKTLGGAHRPDSGEIRVAGQLVSFENPIQARQAGIGVIYQEFNLLPFLTVRENIFLGQAIQSHGVIRAAEERRQARQLLERLGTNLDPETPVYRLSIAEQQLVEIAKTLVANASLVVMDEPTATLTPTEVTRLFGVVRELISRGIGVIYISHRLDEVLELADRVVVLRDGRRVAHREIEQTSRREMIELMVGRDIENEFPKASHSPGAVRLAVENLHWKDRVRDVSFSVHDGEILGLTGLVGAGRTEVARLITGAEMPDSGDVKIDGTPVRFHSPREAIAAGVCLLSEDRKGQGLVLMHSVQENFGLPNFDRFSRLGKLDLTSEANALKRYGEHLKIKLTSGRQSVEQLSGGNQQKVVLAKWLERNCQVMVIDEPTRGIDVGAKYEIYRLIHELADAGKAIIMISSEIPEVLGVCDRVIVMNQGAVSGEISDPRMATQKQVMELAAH